MKAWSCMASGASTRPPSCILSKTRKFHFVRFQTVLKKFISGFLVSGLALFSELENIDLISTRVFLIANTSKLRQITQANSKKVFLDLILFLRASFSAEKGDELYSIVRVQDH